MLLDRNFALLWALTLLPASLMASDGEWPPEADPQWRVASGVVENNPEAPGIGAYNPHLFLDRFEFVIPNTAPNNWANWLTHAHGNQISGCSSPIYGGYQTDFAIGDVDNDGVADDIVITQPGEAVMAAKIDFANQTVTPLWFWLTPYAQGLSGPGHATTSCYTDNRNNPLIWNLVSDGAQDDTNEVAFVGLNAAGDEVLYILRTNPGGGVTVVDQSPAVFEVEHRLGVARVRNTDFPRDIVMSEHQQGRVFVWSHIGGDSGSLQHMYSGDPFSHPDIDAKQHEGNWADIDGDGFDEFTQNGLLDFVDADSSGNAVPLNGTKGLVRWQIMDALSGGQGGNAHCDQVYIGDYDPTRYGLEVYAVTELGSGGKWKDQDGVLHDKALDTLWDADTGALLDEWEEGPAEDGQNIFAGNWTTTYRGMEVILSPKDLPTSSVVIPSGQQQMDGAYTISVRNTPSPTEPDMEVLAIDGNVVRGAANWYETPNSTQSQIVALRAGGPWRRMWGMDWDGDYATDEVLNHPLNKGALSVFRLGDKAELANGFPLGVPDNPNLLLTPAIAGGFWYFYFQGNSGEHIPGSVDDWGWNNGGPGRGTHYFEKLKEVWPNAHHLGASVVHAFDIEGSPDHREEIIAISPGADASMPAKLHIFFNSDPLPAGAIARTSPQKSIAYRQYRQREVITPFSFQDQVNPIVRFGVRPTNSSLPERVAGLDDGGSVQFEAFVEFEDGFETDVTGLVTWDLDAASAAEGVTVSASGNVTVPSGKVLSARIRGFMELEGADRYSEPSYVFSSDSDSPEILRAGFGDSWLVDDAAQDDRTLLVHAFVGQKDNAVPFVFGLNSNGFTWTTLADNGTGGDEIAGDGIFTAELSNAFSAGNSFRTIRAMMPPIGYPVGTLKPTSADSSSIWPYFDLGGGNDFPLPPLPTATPQLFGEVNAYEAPRIGSFGYRGWNVPGKLLLEVELEASVIHPDATAGVFTVVPGVGIQFLTDRGEGIYELELNTGTAPGGLYLFEITPFGLENGSTYSGDTAPWIWSHSYPSWDLDQPADFDPVLTEYEPSGW